MSEQSMQEIRSKALEIGARAKSDPEYLRQLQHEPVETLEQAGLPDAAIGDFLREEGLQPEVSGYTFDSCGSTCTCSTCCITHLIG